VEPLQPRSLGWANNTQTTKPSCPANIDNGIDDNIFHHTLVTEPYLFLALKSSSDLFSDSRSMNRY
jgi:hypothetical protein